MKKLIFGGVLLAVGLLIGISATSSSAAGTGTHVRLEEVTKTITVKARSSVDVSSGCAPGEAVTGGGPTAYPPNLTVAISTLFWDGVHSGGWTVSWKNTTSAAITAYVGVSALCIAPGYMTN